MWQSKDNPARSKVLKDKESPKPCSSKSCIRQIPSPELYKPEITNPESENVPQKSKKKKKASKEERRLQREAKALNDLYKPKDSHVSLLTPEMFRKMRGEATESKKLSSFKPSLPFIQNDSLESNIDFPSLGTPLAPTISKKSFASIISSPPPQVKSEPPSSIGTPLQTPILSSSRFPESIIESEAKPKRLSKTPLIISLDELIVRKEKDSTLLEKQIAKKKNERSSGIMKENHKLTKGNILDSSGPGVIHRGKIRLKAKKPTKLKKCIMKSRELRKLFVPMEFSLTNVKIEAQQEDNPNLVKPEESYKEAIGCDNTIIEKEISETIPSKETQINFDAVKKNESEKVDVDPITKASPTQEDNNENKEFNIIKNIMIKAEEDSKKSEPVPLEVVQLIKLKMHSRKFRNYCDMFVTKEFHIEVVVPFLKELFRLQDRLYKTDPIKFKVKRRFFNGLKDALSMLKLNKAQIIILAPDIEPNNERGGLDDRVSEIITLAKEKNIPYVFSGNRYILGKAIMQLKTPISAIVIIDKQSCEEMFNKVLEEASKLREKYQQDLDLRVKEAMMANRE